MSGPLFKDPIDIRSATEARCYQGCSSQLDEVGEILTLQRSTYVSAALLYDDPRLPGLVQTLEQLCRELTESLALKVTARRRIVASSQPA